MRKLFYGAVIGTANAMLVLAGVRERGAKYPS